jgi:hypothetical protein
MKAVVTLTADASGVQAGVNQAIGHLNRMQQAVSSIRSLAIAGVAMDIGRSMFGGVGELMSRIEDASRSFSPAAMTGANSLAIAEQDTNIKLAEAFGETIGFIDEMKAQGLRDVVDYLVENKEAISQAMVNLAEFGLAIADLTAQGLVKMSEWINEVFGYTQDLMADPGSTVADTTIGVTAELFGHDAARWLEGIYDRLGGE